MRKKLLLLALAIPLALAGFACDDADNAGRDCGSVDSDDCQVGPGDGVDEPGPLR